MDTHLSDCIPIILKSLNENYNLYPRTSVEQEITKIVFSKLRCFELYKDIEVHAKVKEVVPWEALSLESSKKISTLSLKCDSENDRNSKLSIDSRDFFLIELLSWFKKEFFKWFQEPNCEKCENQQMKFSRLDECNNEEKKWKASQVEIYSCSKCSSNYRFPRYNHPIKLLETRTGRCGEWANCFTSMCIVFNYEVRTVSEWSDHVWLEVFSESQQRWVHCDPCENAIDTPLMYEAGWNKKISYCIAVSDREMQDVTWNYTLNPKQVLENRKNKCSENWLLNIILLVTRTLQNKLDPQIVREMNERRVKELVGYLWMPNQKKRELKDNELVGRQSGSLMWRVARGELNDKEDGSLCNNNFMFKPCLSNIIDDSYIIKFNCVKDEYFFEGKSVKGWQNCVYLYKNIYRKVEQDWKVTYLSRNEDSSFSQMGLIAWEINFENLTLSWKYIEIFILSKTYENGSVKMYISSQPEKIKLRINQNEKNLIKRDQFPINCTNLSITVELSGGKGDVGWQHAQIFRQSLFTESSINGLEIKIKF